MGKNKVDGEFIAISYCWGDKTQPTTSLPISFSAYLKITKTVESLLRRVAGVANGLPIWVDAIFINQANVKEKNTQVGMMKDIYAAAKCILVWLENESLPEADELALFRYLPAAWDGSGYIDGDGGALFGRVLQSPWFERSWIVQELCFARKVFFLCGSVGVSLPHL